MRTVLSACAVAILLAGCTAPDGTSASGAASPSAQESDSPSTVGPSTAAPDLGGPAPTVPAETSGPLGRDDVPQAADLGEGWEPFAHPGGAEEGFEGNGEFVRERDPAEVVRSVVPLGCPGVDRVPSLPVPEHALEATYRDHQGLPAVALVLGYPGDDKAVAAIRNLQQMLATCTPPAQGERADALRPVIEIRRADDRAVWDVRRYVGPGSGAERWDEVIVRSGARVALLAVARPVDAPAPNLARLDGTLRRQLGESAS